VHLLNSICANSFDFDLPQKLTRVALIRFYTNYYQEAMEAKHGPPAAPCYIHNAHASKCFLLLGLK